MKRKLPIYEAKVRDTDNTGIFAMSFVEVPAVEKYFIALQDNPRPVKLALNKYKQILTGVVLVPDMLIYRSDNNLGEYYLKYTAADIERISHKMMKTGLALSTTTHQHEKPLAGNYLTELWIVQDPKRDKAVALGLGELKKGTLVASYKVESAKYWREQVLTGKVKGFSLEGIFNFNNVKMSKPNLTPAKAKTVLGKKPNAAATFLKQVAAFLEGDSTAEAEAIVDEAKKDETDSGEPYLIFELADGGEVSVDADGFATLNGEQMPAGEHALADGNVIVIDDAGLLVITAEEPEAAADPATAAAALKAHTAAKNRAKLFLAKSVDPKAAQIAKLKAQIAKLEAEPSTEKATPKVEATAKDVKDMTYTEKMAAVIKSRIERSGK